MPDVLVDSLLVGQECDAAPAVPVAGFQKDGQGVAKARDYISGALTASKY
jgi:hypothetical protein